MAPLFLIVRLFAFLFHLFVVCFRHSFFESPNILFILSLNPLCIQLNAQLLSIYVCIKSICKPLGFPFFKPFWANNFRFTNWSWSVMTYSRLNSQKNKIQNYVLYYPLMSEEKRCSMDMDSNNNTKQILTSAAIFPNVLNQWVICRFDVAIHRTVTISSSNDFRNGAVLTVDYEYIFVHSQQAKDKNWWTLNRDFASF